MKAIVANAREVAKQAHGNQLYGDKPYIYHLDSVYNVALEHIDLFPEDSETILCACFLHDTVEDTPLGLDEIREHFGESVAEIVSLVTTEQGVPRSERFNDQFYKELKANKLAVFVKVCDRIANVREGGKVRKYLRENEKFVDELYSGRLDSLFKSLDDAFYSWSL